MHLAHPDRQLRIGLNAVIALGGGRTPPQRGASALLRTWVGSPQLARLALQLDHPSAFFKAIRMACALTSSG